MKNFEALSQIASHNKKHGCTTLMKNKLKRLMNDAPHGSGIDNCILFELDDSNDSKLVFNLSYHHMNEVGYYDGWTEHKITVKPSLMFTFVINISGKDKNDIKDYLHDILSTWLDEEFTWYVQSDIE